MIKGIQDGGFFVVGANADLSFWLLHLVVAFVELNAQLVPHLCDVERVDIEAVFLFDIGLNVRIGSDKASILSQVFDVDRQRNILRSFSNPSG